MLLEEAPDTPRGAQGSEGKSTGYTSRGSGQRGKEHRIRLAGLKAARERAQDTPRGAQGSEGSTGRIESECMRSSEDGAYNCPIYIPDYGTF
jgi:hypothetical protein